MYIIHVLGWFLLTKFAWQRYNILLIIQISIIMEVEAKVDSSPGVVVGGATEN